MDPFQARPPAASRDFGERRHHDKRDRKVNQQRVQSAGERHLLI
jgi:hypothetical protein